MTSRSTRSVLRVALLSAPADWSPRAWDDFPESGRVLELTDARGLDWATGVLFAHNQPRVDAPDGAWAVLVDDPDVRPGVECWRGIPRYSVE